VDDNDVDEWEEACMNHGANDHGKRDDGEQSSSVQITSLFTIKSQNGVPSIFANNQHIFWLKYNTTSHQSITKVI
jgi:hypothetical protein